MPETSASIGKWARGKDECYAVFYAVWCPHCVALMQRLQGELRGTGAEMVSVKGGAYPKTDVAKFVESENIGNDLDVRAFPTVRHYVGGEEQEDEGSDKIQNLIRFLKNKLTGKAGGRSAGAAASSNINQSAPYALHDGYRGQQRQIRGRSPSPAPTASRGCGRNVVVRSRSPPSKPPPSWDGYRTQQRASGRNTRARSRSPPASRRG